ncbi:photosystem II cytochrome c-550 [Spirulina subsalsa]|uniref:photosystem II cytochrome c-550 n=1 Tax=Spirulina subsalsa TaxID=54311 RepID=UPI0002E97B07
MRRLKFLWIAAITLILGFQVAVQSAMAVNISESNRTVKLNEAGETVTITNQQFELGKREFNNTCSQCHMSGRTKTNPNVTLGLGDLEGAFPTRDNLLAIVDYTKNPTTYDGETDISDLHPSTSRLDLWPEMRNLTQEDLENLAGYILAEINIRGDRWGAGKVYD